MIKTLEIKGTGIHLTNIINIDSETELDCFFNNHKIAKSSNGASLLSIATYGIKQRELDFEIEQCYNLENLVLQKQVKLPLNDELLEAIEDILERKTI